jgi:hypothetical protein
VLAVSLPSPAAIITNKGTTAVQLVVETTGTDWNKLLFVVKHANIASCGQCVVANYAVCYSVACAASHLLSGCCLRGTVLG